MALKYVLAALVAAVAVAQEPDVLTQDTFASSVGNGDRWLVKFYAPWCGHCKRLAPVWDQMAATVAAEDNEAKVHIAKVDCTVQRDVCTEQGVRGYPTLMLFKNGEKEGVKYSGAREAQPMLDFAKTA